MFDSATRDDYHVAKTAFIEHETPRQRSTTLAGPVKPLLESSEERIAPGWQANGTNRESENQVAIMIRAVPIRIA